MPIYAKQSNTWYTGNAPASVGRYPIYAKWNGTWYGGVGMWVKWNGTWYGAGYYGQPGQCQNQNIASAADNFSQVAVGYWGPAGGPGVDYYIVRMYDYYGNYITGNRSDTPGNQPGLHYFNVNPDTAYIFRVFAVNAAGEGPPTPDIRYAIGHAQQTRQDANYGWGGEYDCRGAWNEQSSYIGGHEPDYAVDWPNGNWASTTWLSGARSSVNGAEALRITPSGYQGADDLCRGVRMWLTWGRRLFVGICNVSGYFWYGGTNYLTNRGLWWSAAQANVFAHDYCHASGVGVPSNQEYQYRPYDEGIDIRAGNMFVDCAVDQLDYVAGGYRGGFVEIIFRFQHWQVVSYTTVVTVNQQNCYYY